MIRILNINPFITHKVSQNILPFEEGDVVQFTTNYDSRILVKSNGLAPYGIVAGKRLVNDYFHVEILLGRGVVETNNYDDAQFYPINANLFVENGRFTTRQPSPIHPCVAVVTDSPDKETNKPLELLWL